ncbi:hypothetical protein JCM10212_006885 [Sporobolomyces blumeae]
MSFEGQAHHPHRRGFPPNAHLLAQQRPPANLELVQAHWFVRHGERAPVRQRMVGLGAIPPVFNLCSIGKDFSQAVLSLAPTPALRPTVDSAPSPSPFLSSSRHSTSATTSAFPPSSSKQAPPAVNGQSSTIRRFTEDPPSATTSHGRPTRGDVAACYWGELTDLGRESTLRFGATLRHVYVDRLGFLPGRLDQRAVDDGVVQFRSTNMPRTIESLQQIIEGLYDGERERDPPRGVRVEIRVRNWMDENLYPNTASKRLRVLDAESIQRSATEHNPSLATLDDAVVPVLGHALRIDSSPRANGILDTLMVCRAHGIDVPDVLARKDVLEVLEKGVVREWFDAYQVPEFRRLAMGRILSDLSSCLAHKIARPEEDPLKLAVYSCHDTSVGGILNALDAFDGRWPPFTSHLGIELMRQTPTPATDSSTQPPGPSNPPSSSAPSFLSRFLPSPAATLPPSSSSRDSSRHFVRLLYNGKPLALPACQPVGSHLEGTQGTVCTYEAFERLLSEWKMGEKEWTEACNKGAE